MNALEQLILRSLGITGTTLNIQLAPNSKRFPSQL